MKNALFAALIAGSTLFVPALAEAACQKTGTIIRVVMRDASSTIKHTINLRVNPVDTFYYTARTNDPAMAQAAIVLNSLGTPVRMSGDASSCPTSGTNRFMGLADFIIASP